MTQMRTTGIAHDLGTAHAQRVVNLLFNHFTLGRLIEAGPAAARVVLVLRVKQSLTAANTRVRAITLVAIVLTGKGALSAFLPGYFQLCGR